MTVTCWINGEPGTRIEVSDRGLQYGDGVFETLAVRDGRITLLDFHLQRLMEGCRRLLIPSPSPDVIRDELNAAARDQQRAVLKLIVTRGSGGRGYRPPLTVSPNRILTVHDWPAYRETWWEQGINARICTTVLGNNPQLAGIKHLNRLEQILARAEWPDTDDIQEGLMTDAGGSLIEGTMTNVFARLADGKLVTPDLQTCGVAGVMRRHLLEQAERTGIAVHVGGFKPAEVRSATEVFVCNSVIGVWPVRQLDDWSYRVGEMTRKFQQWAGEA